MATTVIRNVRRGKRPWDYLFHETDWLNRVYVCSVSAAVRSFHQQQQQLGKPGESRKTSPRHDKENMVTSSSPRVATSKSIFGCVELLAETSRTRPPHLTIMPPPYLVTHVDQSPSSRYRHVTSSPAAMFAAVTSSPVAPPTPVGLCTLLFSGWKVNPFNFCYNFVKFLQNPIIFSSSLVNLQHSILQIVRTTTKFINSFLVYVVKDSLNCTGKPVWLQMKCGCAFVYDYSP